MNSLKNDFDSSDELKILSNSVRQRILKLISEQGSISFTSLKDELKLTDGSLFYHLKMLNTYIQKDQQNFYQLSEQGKVILDSIIHKKFVVSVEKKETGWFLDKITFPDMFYYFFGDPVRSLIELNLLLIVISWLFGVSNTQFSSVEAIFSGGAIVNSIISVIHWYLYLLVIVIILKLLKSDINFKKLWIGIFSGLIPYFIYLIPTAAIYYSGTLIEPWLKIILNILFSLCKIYSTFLVAQGINLSSSIKKYQALIVACVLIFIDYLYLIITI